MAILEVPDSRASLSQGDVLKGVPLFVTGEDSPQRRKADLSLVLSRPCVVANKSHFVVAAVKATEEVQKNVDTSDKIKQFLNDIRDGMSRPDRFYLGQMPGEPNARHYAELDSLHTINSHIGTEHRIARLSQEFVRDLHVRIFGAFARLGFDDYGWYSDEDLEWLVSKFTAEMDAIRADLSDNKSRLTSLRASGGANQHRLDADEKCVAKLEAKLAQAQLDAKPFESESERRKR